MAVTSLSIKEQVASVFLSYFGRAPEYEAMAHYAGELELLLANHDADTAYKLLSAQIYIDGVRHGEVPAPAGISNEEYVELVYRNVFGREADEVGLEYWTSMLDEGQHTRAELVALLINAALDNPDDSRDRDYIMNRTYVAVEFAKWENSNPQILGDLEYNAAQVLEGVNESPASVEAGLSKLYENAGELGRTYELTLERDVITGNDGNDVFDAPLQVTVGGLVAAQTLQGQDVLDGGGGWNTLNAELNYTGTSWDPTIKNIQVYNLTAVSGVVGPLLQGGALDLNRAEGYEEIWNVNSRANLTVYNVRTDADGDAPVLGLRNVMFDTVFTVIYDAGVPVYEQTVIADRVGSVDGDVELNINVPDTFIDVLNLEVSNGVYLYLTDDAADIDDLNIVGTDYAEITADDDFLFLENLDATGHDGGLVIDISGTIFLESARTGAGNDAVLVNNIVLDGNTVIDLGGGHNVLGIEAYTGVFDADDITSLDFNTTSNVQILWFDSEVELDDNAVLDFDGFDVPPAIVVFDEEVDGNGFELALANAAESLTIELNDDLGDIVLDTGNVVDLVINSFALDGIIDIDDLTGASLETLTVNQIVGVGGFVWMDIDADTGHDVTQLRDVTVNATGTAVVELEALNADVDNFDNLTNIAVAAGGDAVLRLQGTAGVVEVIGQNQIDQITITTGGSGSQVGNIVFNSSSFPSGVISTSYSATGLELPRSNWAALDVASDLAAGSSGLFTATVPTLLGIPTSNVITVEWADYQQHLIEVFSQNATSGSLNSVSVVTVQPGIEPVEMQPGEGFEALETIEVIGGEDAIVELEDVYGSFFLDVTAGEDAWVDLWNTQAVSVTVTAGDWADIDVGGDTIGNWDLVDVTVDANAAWVTLEDALYSFWVLDVTNVDSYLYVDTEDAEFGDLATGEYITYLLGNTGDYDDLTVDVDFWGNLAARELYAFVGDDIQNVVINNFTAGADPVYGDRIDLSSFGYTNAGQLVFTTVGADLVITDLEGGIDGFSGSITIVGGAAAADDIALYNIIYA